MKKIILISTFILFINCYSQLSSDKLKLIEPLSKIDYAESSNVGVAGEESKIYYAFENIKNNLSNEDLLILTKNSSNSLRLYSSLELVKRNDPKIVSVYQYYTDFPLKMLFRAGCVGKKVDLTEMIYFEFKNSFDMKKELEEMISLMSKDELDSNYAKDIVKEFDKLNKRITPDFIETFNKLKEIKSEFQ